MAEKIFEPTYGTFVLSGIITGKDNPKEGFGYKESTRKDGDVDIEFRTIKFYVNTEEGNFFPVELYGEVRNNLVAKNKATGEDLKVTWEKRNEALPDGFFLYQQEYDKVKEYNENFKDGDKVYIYGKLLFKEFQNAKGDFVEGVSYRINKMGLQTKETSSNRFTQPIVIENFSNDEDNNLLVHAKIITNKNGKTCSATFKVVREIGDDDSIKKIKNFKFGDFVIVEGIMNHKTVGEPIKETIGLWDDETDINEDVVRGFDKSFVIKKFLAKSIVVGKYTEEELKAKNKLNEIYEGNSKTLEEVLTESENRVIEQAEPEEASVDEIDIFG